MYRIVRESVASDVAGDVGDETVEVGDLEELVESDELQVDDSLVTDDRRRGSVWQSSVGILLDGLSLLRAGIWQTIGQLVRRG